VEVLFVTCLITDSYLEKDCEALSEGLKTIAVNAAKILVDKLFEVRKFLLRNDLRGRGLSGRTSDSGEALLESGARGKVGTGKVRGLFLRTKVV
jgi:hypothetical protein